MLVATTDVATGSERTLTMNRFENFYYVGIHLRCLAINMDQKILSMDAAAVKTCSQSETAKRVEQVSLTRIARTTHALGPSTTRRNDIALILIISMCYQLKQHSAHQMSFLTLAQNP